MKKRSKQILSNILLFALVGALFSIIVIAQGPGHSGAVTATNQRSPAQPTVSVPSHAIELAPGVFSLGEASLDGRAVQGYMIIDHKDRRAKPDNPGNGKGKGGKGGGSETCYTPLAKGAKWLSAQPWILNTANAEGIDGAQVQSDLQAALDSWEAQGGDIFGAGSLTGAVLEADTSSPDGQNEVYFGSIDGTGSIAVTIVWGIFSGPPHNRELVEWDMVFDDAEFTFGNAGPTDENNLGDTSVMDLLAIATHEAGHAAGMSHPSDTCTEETMYAYAQSGETKKRTLNAGDIAGIQDLYA